MQDSRGCHRSWGGSRRDARAVRTDHGSRLRGAATAEIGEPIRRWVDAVDTEAAQRHRVWVCNVPDYGTTEVALHAVAMLLALLRNLAGHDRAVRSGDWDYHLGGELRRPSSLTLGVVGLGGIGRMAAERAAPWFGAVVGYDPYLPD